MKKLLLLLACFITGASFAQTKPTEVLLIGTFHFNNPGADIVKVKTFDVMTPKVQTELETMTDQINLYQPAKIFVEWPWDEQRDLDALYAQYLGGKYEEYVTAKYIKPSQRDFYLKNEIFQLAFRAGKKLKLAKIHAIDYKKTNFPYDSVMKAMNAAHQDKLLKNIDALMKSHQANTNKKLETYTLTQLLLDHNKPESRTFDTSFYLTLLNRAGTADAFVGPFLVSEWYRRNLYMYSLVQKLTETQDDKVMILAGASHTAMMKEFIDIDNTFQVKELKDVLSLKK
ncbi:hypothetical protein SAMN00120144_1842 [Hymenobacter roseosalivarius DSM 11622]|uniref:TraB/GumN family protein n=1 Tax=Hymenobacter roseosalivarius DSM 11622 TaxID=645990 RepID=A0A1W1VNZ4_9BACT|nr:DUF5694 domain-containing protein [Hymenobacter roseosalivarius]SMB94993.1 hypothetical protein SAMN00120144_1842 [Hymenobacter roseosalivarius DSM 11622]